jgi:hypothetical protein
MSHVISHLKAGLISFSEKITKISFISIVEDTLCHMSSYVISHIE